MCTSQKNPNLVFVSTDGGLEHHKLVSITVIRFYIVGWKEGWLLTEKLYFKERVASRTATCPWDLFPRAAHRCRIATLAKQEMTPLSSFLLRQASSSLFSFPDPIGCTVGAGG